MKTRHAFDPSMKKHITFFIFMMLLICIIFFKNVYSSSSPYCAEPPTDHAFDWSNEYNRNITKH